MLGWFFIDLISKLLHFIDEAEEETNEKIECPTNDSQTIDELPKPKKCKSETSQVWTFFTKTVVGDDGIEICKCGGCNKVYKTGSKSHETSTLTCHIKVCPKIKFEDVGQIILDVQGIIVPFLLI